MTFQELEALASPAPWTVVDGKLCDEEMREIPLSRYELDGPWYSLDEEKNAMLAAHCRNHFAKALDMLKQWQAAYDEWCASPDPASVEFPDTHEDIKRLETAEP